MSIQFLLDETKKKQAATIAEILKVIKKKPYPDDKSTILADFVSELFEAGERLKKKETLSQPVSKEHKIFYQKFKKEHIPKIPIPSHKLEEIHVPKPQNKIKRREYVIELFSNPIGILLEQHPETHKFKYKIFEPILDDKFLIAVKKEIAPYLKKNINAINEDQLLMQIIKKIGEQFGIKANVYRIKNLKYYLNRDLLGFRRLDVLMHDSKVKEIIVAGINKPIKIRYEGIDYLIETNIKFSDKNDLKTLILRIAKTTGKIINEKHPILNVTYEGYKIKGTFGVGGISSKLHITKI